MRRLLLCLVAWSLPVVAHAEEALCPPISGQAQAREDGAPLAGVRVFIEGMDAVAVSGADGTFHFNVPSLCEAVVIAEAPGRERLEVFVVSADAPRFLRLHLLRAGSYQSTVVAPRLTVPTASSEVVTSRELQAVPLRTAEDALRLVSGLTLVQHGSEGKGQQFFLRGFDAEHGSGLELRVEGVPLNEWSNVHALGYLDLGLLIPETLRSLEVTKGPFALDQGAFGVAGSATYRLGMAEGMRGLRLGATLGSTSRFRGVVSYSPSQGDGSDFIALEGLQDAGYGQRRAIRRGALTGQLRLFESPRSGTLTLMGAGLLADFELPGTLRLEDVQAGRIGFYDAYDQEGRGRSARGLLSLRHHWEGAESEVTSRVWAGLRRLSLLENYTGALIDPVEGDRRGQHQEGWSFGASVGFEHALHASLRLVGGIDLRAEVLNQGQAHVGADGTLLAQERALSGVQVLPGARVGVQWRPTSGWSLAAGTRVDLAHVAVRDALDADAAGQGTLVSFSPRITSQWRLHPALRLFAAYGRGFRPPEARAFSSFTPERTGIAEDLYDGGEPRMTEADSLELGVRWRPHRVLSGRLSTFATYVARESIFDHVSGLNLELNRTQRLGAELELSLNPFEGLSLNADLTFADARFIDSGNPVPHAPTWVAGLLGIYTHQSGWRGGLRFTGIAPRPLPHGARGGTFAQLDATAGYRYRWLDVGLELENLLFQRLREGEYHYASVWGDGGAASALPVLHFVAGPPFNARLTLAVTF